MKPLRGIQMLKETCSSKDVITIENAMLNASHLAGAGLAAATNPTDLPFKFFFGKDLESVNEVVTVYCRVQELQHGNGPLIVVSCRDFYFRCHGPRNPYALQGYASQTPTRHRSGQIVMCPLGLALDRNPPPCSQFPSFSHFGVPPDRGVSQTAAQIGAMVSEGVNTTHNDNALACIASWSWDLGPGGPPWN
ncbi:MAG: hypothetical protein LQ352_000707 [Teloschistes flavicans]|nr:MAG: hypothetical protein LQ352_000707 [Teloschistes flavicans]